MKPHDYSELNDAQCVHVDHFAERLRYWRERNLGEATCWQVARREAVKRIALDEDEQAGVDDYVATRFERRRSERMREGLPVTMLVAK